MLFRFQSVLPAVAALLSLASGLPADIKRDVAFEQFRGLTNNHRDHSGRLGDPPEKYFHESTFHPHYDGRFSTKPIPEDERIGHLTALCRTYLSTMHDIGAETWIVHGSLLGWWWNRKIMPWDTDIDVQVSERSIKYLSDYYNMTVHHFRLPGEDKDRKYLIEVNPHWENGSTDDWLNVIDARWIDLDTGLFIDITTVRWDPTASETEEPRMMSKDGHRYLQRQVFPLRDSTFEGMPVKIPFAYSELLEGEYGPSALTNMNFENHHFDQTVMEWIHNDHPRSFIAEPEKPVEEPKVGEDDFIHEISSETVPIS